MNCSLSPLVPYLTTPVPFTCLGSRIYCVFEQFLGRAASESVVDWNESRRFFFCIPGPQVDDRFLFKNVRHRTEPIPRIARLRSESRLVTRFRIEGNGSLHPRIKSPEGVMNQSRVKKQPTRDDLAATWRTIRDQSRIIKLLTETIRRQDKVLGNVLMAYPRLEELRVN